MATRILVGATGSPGVAAGRLLWVAAGEASRGPEGVAPNGDEAATGGPEAERERLRRALEAAATDLEALARDCAKRAGEEVGAIFEAQSLFARDPAIVDAAMAAIGDGADAVAAIERATAEQAEVLASLDDEYFRERAADVRDVGRRVVGVLTGQPPPVVHHADGTAAIVAGVDLDPSVVAQVRPELVAGLAMSGGASNGHAAIVARALGIPLVIGLGAALGPEVDGLDAVVDGSAGRLVVDPTAAELDRLLEPAALPAAAPADDVLGLPVRIEANVGSVREAEQAAAAGAEGIGLVRTEILFLGRAVPPGLDEQRSLYRRIRDSMAGRPVVFRTLDIGGDKPASWAVAAAEPNPALGVRGIRLGLRRRELLETQLRALLEAAAGGTLDVMLPMVATVEEVVAARELLDDVAAASRREGREVAADVRLGIMIEVPAAALTAATMARHVDFFSIGTNDLVQYTMAADRTNPALDELATAFQPAVLRLVSMLCEAAAAASRPVAVCGEAAADPAAAAVLVGLGVGELSMAPAAIPAVRRALAALDMAACREAAGRALAAPDAAAARRIGETLVSRAAEGRSGGVEAGAIRAG